MCLFEVLKIYVECDVLLVIIAGGALVSALVSLSVGSGFESSGRPSGLTFLFL